MSNNLSFVLRVRPVGFEFDGVTQKKKTYVGIVGGDQKQIIEVLLKNEIQHTIIPKNDVFTSEELFLEPKDMFTVIRLLEEEAWVIKEYPPFFVWKVISESEEIPQIDVSVLREKIGCEIWDKLHAYQQVGVQKMVQLKKSFNADEMGCGKTLQALITCQYYAEQWPVLISCPSSLKFTWKSEIMNWLQIPEKEIFVIGATKDLAKIPTNHKFLIISYNLLIRPVVIDYMKAHVYDVMILDESHYIKSLGSQRSNATLQVIANSNIRILLSGTPFNYPSEMYQQIKALNPTIYPWFFNYRDSDFQEPGKYYYATRYCKPAKVNFRNVESWVFKGYDRSEELNSVLNTFMVRRKKSDVLSQLPEKTRICITLPPLSAKEQKKVDSLLQDDSTKKKKKEKGEKKEKVEKKFQFQEQSREKYMEAFRLSSQFKTPHVIEFIKDQVIGDLLKENKHMKVLIFFHHQNMMESIRELLQEKEIKFFLIDGSTPPIKRQEYVDSFQNTNKYNIALLSITAASTGLTLTAASTVIFSEVLFGPDLHLQAESRSDRMGQKNMVNIFYLIQAKSTDEINFGLIKKKERESSRIIDGKASHIESTRYDHGTQMKEMMNKKKRSRTDGDSQEEETVKRPRVVVNRRALPVVHE